MISGGWFAAISAAFAAVAALANLWIARRATKSNEVNIFLEFSDRYRDPKIRDAVKTLAEFWRSNKDAGVAHAWLELKHSNDAQADEISSASRILGGYFLHAAQLYNLRLVSKPVVRELISRPGLNIFYEVVAPITLAQQPSDNSGRVERSIWTRHLKTLRKLRRKYGNGIY